MKVLLFSLTLIFASNSFAENVCREEYEAKIKKMSNNKRRESIIMGVEAGFFFTGGLVAGAIGAGAGMPMLAIPGMFAGAALGHGVIKIADRKDTIIQAHNIFELAEISKEEDFDNFRGRFLKNQAEKVKAFLTQPELLVREVGIYNFYKVEGKADWTADSVLKHHAEKDVKIADYKNEIDTMVEALNKKNETSYSYSDVQSEIAAIAESGEACSGVQLMGYKKLNKIVGKNL